MKFWKTEFNDSVYIRPLSQTKLTKALLEIEHEAWKYEISTRPSGVTRNFSGEGLHTYYNKAI